MAGVTLSVSMSPRFSGETIQLRPKKSKLPRLATYGDAFVLGDSMISKTGFRNVCIKQ